MAASRGYSVVMEAVLHAVHDEGVEDVGHRGLPALQVVGQRGGVLKELGGVALDVQMRSRW